MGSVSGRDLDGAGNDAVIIFGMKRWLRGATVNVALGEPHQAFTWPDSFIKAQTSPSTSASPKYL